MSDAPELARRLGLRRSGRSWRGACPACGYPGTLSIREGVGGRPLWSCFSCGDRDALARVLGGGARVPLPDPPAARTAADADASRRDRALALWAGSDPVPGTLAGRYLARRGIAAFADSPALRFRPDAPHPEGGRLPALVALVQAADGAPLGVHRTYLAPDGGKARIEPAKASLGPIGGGAVRLRDAEPGAWLAVAEGIETAASAGLLIGVPAWAAVSAGNLGHALALPPGVRRVVVAADPDDPGRRAARAAWTRWAAEGREARIASPEGPGDFNDTLLERGAVDG
jgi:putative DNA primase/helicase